MYWSVACLVFEPDDHVQCLNLITKRRFLTSLVLLMAVDSLKAWCSNLIVLCPSSYGYSDNVWNIVVSHALLISALELSGQFHASAALPPGKTARYPLCRRLGGPQSRSGRNGQDDKSLYPSWTGATIPPPSSPLIYSLYWLSYPGLDDQEFSQSFMEPRVWFVFSEGIPLWSFALTTFIHTTPSSSFFEVHCNIILTQHQIPRSDEFPLNFPAELLYNNYCFPQPRLVTSLLLCNILFIYIFVCI